MIGYEAGKDTRLGFVYEESSARRCEIGLPLIEARPRFIAPKACARVVLVCAALASTAARAEPPPAQQPASPLRLPAFLALGLGGLTASGAVVAGVASSSSSHADPKLECGSHCGAPTDRALSMTSKILTGVAAASVGVGLVLLLTPHKERPSFAPSLGVGISATKATAKATWTF